MPASAIHFEDGLHSKIMYITMYSKRQQAGDWQKDICTITHVPFIVFIHRCTVRRPPPTSRLAGTSQLPGTWPPTLPLYRSVNCPPVPGKNATTVPISQLDQSIAWPADVKNIVSLSLTPRSPRMSPSTDQIPHSRQCLPVPTAQRTAEQGKSEKCNRKR